MKEWRTFSLWLKKNFGHLRFDLLISVGMIILLTVISIILAPYVNVKSISVGPFEFLVATQTPEFVEYTLITEVDQDNHIQLRIKPSADEKTTHLIFSSWDEAFDATLDDAQGKENSLFVLYNDDVTDVTAFTRVEYQLPGNVRLSFESSISNGLASLVRRTTSIGNGNIVIYLESPSFNFEPTPFDIQACPGAPKPRVKINDKATVCTKTDRLYIREAPGKSSDIISALFPGTIFTVLDGPVCQDNWNWWKVRTSDGLLGWVSEGGDEVEPYFICPLE